MNQQGDRLDVVIKQVFERMKKLSPKPESCPDDELLAAHHEGALTQKETEKIEDHLVLCDKCTENLLLLSEVEGSYDSGKENLATDEMLWRAKNLVRAPVEPSFGKRPPLGFPLSDLRQ